MLVDLVSGIVQILGHNDITVGTGFIVSNSGLIATCAHVVQAAEIDPTGKLTVLFQKTGSKCSASVIRKWWSSLDNKDVAILELESEIPEGVQVLPLGTSKGTYNHEVESFGFPSVGTIYGLWGEGTVYDRVTDRRGNTLLQINSSEITAGFSGSPLLDNSKQRVIGMIVSIAKEDTYNRLRDTAFAVPIETLQSICPTIKIEDMCPYRGLLSFTEEDQEFFFGRDKLVQDLMNQLRSNPRFLALVGSLGSGKSSVISGGLLPRIRRDEILGFENAQIITFLPGIDPNQSLKREVDLFISTGILDLWDGISVYLQKEPDKRLVIFADQFEELFTISLDNERSQFIGNFIRLLESGLKISLILTIRADFYSFLLESEFGKYLRTGQINVRPMSKEEIEQAIEKPAEAIRLQIETGLTNLIITDLKDTKDPLPLLEFTLTKLWERRSDGVLSYESYRRIGGVTGTIGQWADEIHCKLTDKEKELARRIFTRLIHYGEKGTPDSRRRLPLDELAESEDKETIHKLITKLADAHLLITDRELSTGIETVEIIHDSLLTEWGQLKEWINEDHIFLLWRKRLKTRINEWQRRDKDEGSLLHGAALFEASKWSDKHKKELSQPEIDYIKSSLELKEREKTTPFAPKTTIKRLPLIDQKLKFIIKKIKDKAKIACKESRHAPTQEIVCAVNKEVQKWEVSNQEKMSSNVLNLITILKSKIPHTVENEGILDLIESMKDEQDLVNQYQILPSVIGLIPTINVVPVEPIIEKIDNSERKILEEIQKISEQLNYVAVSSKPEVNEALILHLGYITSVGGVEYTLTVPLQGISYFDIKEELKEVSGKRMSKLSVMPKKIAKIVEDYLIKNKTADILNKLR